MWDTVRHSVMTYELPVSDLSHYKGYAIFSLSLPSPINRFLGFYIWNWRLGRKKKLTNKQTKNKFQEVRGEFGELMKEERVRKRKELRYEQRERREILQFVLFHLICQRRYPDAMQEFEKLRHKKGKWNARWLLKHNFGDILRSTF